MEFLKSNEAVVDSWVKKVTTIEQATEYFGTFKNMSALEAKIVLDNKYVEWRPINCVNQAMLLIYEEQEFETPEGFIKETDNMLTYEILEADKTALDDLYKYFMDYTENNDGLFLGYPIALRIKGDQYKFRFMNDAMVGNEEYMPPSTKETIKDLWDKL